MLPTRHCSVFSLTVLLASPMVMPVPILWVWLVSLGGREQLGGGYAGTTGLTARAHGQRESEGAGARGEGGRRRVGPDEQ